jgi:hypothetical protein
VDSSGCCVSGAAGGHQAGVGRARPDCEWIHLAVVSRLLPERSRQL